MKALLARLLRPGPRRILFVVGLLGLALLRWFDLHPVVLPSPTPSAAGRVPSDLEPGDVLLVVDPDKVRAASLGRTFAGADWSYGWLNILEQEWGRRAVVAPSGLPAALAGRRLVVLSGSALAGATPAAAALEGFVRGGGVLVVDLVPGESPGAGDPTRAAARYGAAPPAGGRPVVVRGLSLSDGSFPELASLPGPRRVLPLDCAAGSGSVVLRAGDQPVGCLARRGAGAVLTLGCDPARLITSLQQGEPTGPGFALANRHPGRLSANLESSDLVAHGSLLDNPIPFADLVERALAGLSDAAGPLPRWWGFPKGAAGAYLVTHDEEGMGDRAAWMARDDFAHRGRATWFLMRGAGFGPEALAAIRTTGSIGLHWNPRAEPDEETATLLGFGPVRPLARMVGLSEQVAWFAKTTGARPILNRNHYLLWDVGWDQPFRNLAAVGVRLDSTYGPDVGCRGYLFGTGRPFVALASDGLPLDVRELPFQTAEELGGANPAYRERLLAESATLYHTAVVPLFHPNVFAWRPNAASFLAARRSFDRASQLGLWVGDLGEYERFEEARRASPLTSSFSNGVLQLSAMPRSEGMAVDVPLYWQGRTLTAVLRGGVPVAWQTLPGSGGPRALITLGVGALAELQLTWSEGAP